jgi:hypothetical protein
MTVSCFTCGRTCNAQRDLDQHLNATGHWRGLECDQCDSLLFDQRDLVSHIKTEHGYNFLCEDCDNCFIDSTALEQHRAAVHDALVCRYCQGSKFNTQSQLDKHVGRWHSFTCEICGEVTKHKKKHERHLRQHESDSDAALPHECPCCEERYQDESTLQSHIADAHPWKCDKCNTYFNTQFAHDQHKFKEHNSVKLPCEYCTKKLATAEALQTHIAAYHSHKCEKCAMVFSSVASLELHHTQTHVLKCFKCAETFGDAETRLNHFWKVHSFKCCGLSFDTAEILQEHKDLAHLSSCEACTRTFPSLAVFESHRDIYHNYNCKDCGDNFTSIAELVDHNIAKHPIQQTNLPTLPRFPGLRCTKCPEELHSAQDLLDHDKKMHRHICEKCDAIFENYLALKRHITSAHVITCPACSMECPDATTLITYHIAMHMLKCELCAADSADHHSLQTHMATFHGTQENLPCDSCAMTFPSTAALDKHCLRSGHWLWCEVCPDKLFCTFAERDSHVISAHPCISESDTSYETSPDHFSPEKKSAPNTPPSAKGFFTPPSTAPTTRKATSAATASLHQDMPTRATKSKTIFQCDTCTDATFDTRADYDQHMEFSPFHGEPVLKCFECNLVCKNQIALLTHIESKPHNVRWVLSMISTD